MANMLIRTTNNECKYKIAVLIRVFLFFGIPSVYFVYSRVIALSSSPNIANLEPLPDESLKVPLRHLLGLVHNRTCIPAAILEFPPDGLTRYQRQTGFIAIHCMLAIYCFLLLGTVCEQYFVPVIEIICERLNLAADIAGATFMAAASSSPELFINCVGTFVTEGDLGVGAVVGSAVFNVLAVPACCALVANRVIDLDWWSISRDCLMYAVAVIALILTLLDDKVYWQEAMLLVLMYTIYILAMIFNDRLGSFVKSGCCARRKPKMYTEITPLLKNGRVYLFSNEDTAYCIRQPKFKEKNNPLDAVHRVNGYLVPKQDDVEFNMEISKRHDSTTSDDSSYLVWSWPDEKMSGLKKVLWVLLWPISLLLWATIPDCRRHPNLYPLTFIMCISWIGGVSYIVAWIITVIGDTLNVPDSITGLTILAAGTSLPEAVSSVLVTNHGHGTMGISNSIGSNTFDILLCLGLPWLVKSLFFPSIPGHHWVSINSSGLSYSAISLLSTLFTLYGALALNKFQLDWKIGLVCSLVYIGFLILASLIELNILFEVNLPVCPH